MSVRYRNGWWLEIKYREEGLTQREIAEECGVSPRTIREYTDEYGIETRDVEGENHGLYGKERDEEVREKISESLSGITRPESTRQKMSESTAGEQNPNWRGGYSRRYGAGWSTAQERVLERDEVCQHCGADGSERRLEVHHIVPVRRFREAADTRVEDAHDPGNLVVLCNRCHPKADYGDLEFESDVADPLCD